MTNEKIKRKSIAFCGTVVIALIVIGYFSLSLNKDSKKELNQSTDLVLQNPSSTAVKEATPTSEVVASTTGQTKEDNATSSPDNPEVTTTPSQNDQFQSTIVQDNSVQETEKAKQAENANQKQPQQTLGQVKVTPISTPEQVKSTPIPILNDEPTAKPDNNAIKITKSEVTSTAKFYPYNVDGVAMEVIAVKASDGTIRTALNTCQVCFDSGRGYYEQEGEYLVCQNCRNRFHIDQVEKVKGGCNPVPIIEENKQDAGEYITISKDFMASQKEYFSKWKKKYD